MNKDIPIIFSGPMVRALLEGRKTMTRRVLKAEMPPAPAMDAINPANVARHATPYFDAYCSELRSPGNPRGMSRNWCWWTRDDRQCLPTVNVRYAPGDRLWVRESALYWIWNKGPDQGKRDKVAAYAADGYDLEAGESWTPSIHMERRFSRLTLIVTGVKVERLQEISKEDAIAEGATPRPSCSGFRSQYDGWSMDWSWVGRFSQYATGGPGPLQERDISLATPQSAFGEFINVLHGGERWNMPGKPAPIWDQNPFVVAVTFRVIKANIDAPEARAA